MTTPARDTSPPEPRDTAARDTATQDLAFTIAEALHFTHLEPSGCPYYRYYREGGEPASCNQGCHDEPSCVTDEPEDGWPRWQARAEQAERLTEIHHATGADEDEAITALILADAIAPVPPAVLVTAARALVSKLDERADTYVVWRILNGFVTDEFAALRSAIPPEGDGLPDFYPPWSRAIGVLGELIDWLGLNEPAEGLPVDLGRRIADVMGFRARLERIEAEQDAIRDAGSYEAQRAAQAGATPYPDPASPQVPQQVDRALVRSLIDAELPGLLNAQAARRLTDRLAALASSRLPAQPDQQAITEAKLREAADRANASARRRGEERDALRAMVASCQEIVAEHEGKVDGDRPIDDIAAVVGYPGPAHPFGRPARASGEGTAQPDPPAYDPGREHLTLAEIEELDHHGHWDVEEIETLIRTTKVLAGQLRASGEGTAPQRQKWPHRDDEELREKMATAQRQGFTALAAEIETELAERGTAPQPDRERIAGELAEILADYGDDLTDADDRVEAINRMAELSWGTAPQVPAEVLWEGETLRVGPTGEPATDRSRVIGGEVSVPPGTRVRVVAADGAPQPDHHRSMPQSPETVAGNMEDEGNV